MTPKQIREIAEAMKDCGIEYLKFEGLILKCRQMPARATIAPEPAQTTVQVPVAPTIDPPVEGGPPLEEVEVPHNIQKLQSLLKMSDHELVDQLFPEPKEPDEVA